MNFGTVLITGCGGDIGLSLARIVREVGIAERLIGCDTLSNHGGLAFFDACELVPRADEPGYFAAIEKLISDHNIDLMIPMSESEIHQMHGAGRLEKIAGVPVLAANPLAVEIGLDKYATYKKLAANGLPAPWTRIVSEDPPASLPCIIKPRRGQGSKGVRLVETQDEVDVLTRERANDVWQELLLPEEEEHTCGVFRSSAGETRFVVLRRQLKTGFTVAARVVDPAPFTDVLHNVADALSLRGAINVQLRVTATGPKIFEINPRFSSTVGFRHKIGFQDFIWSLQDKCGAAIAPYDPPKIGTRVFRVPDEIVRV